MSRKVIVSPLIKETKIHILNIIKLLRSDERYLIPKTIDLLSKIDIDYQREFILYISKFNEVKFWKESADDSTLYLDVFRSILFYYTGRKDLRQPCKEDLMKVLADYTRSEDFESVGPISTYDMSSELTKI